MKKYTGELLIIIGSGAFTYGLFNFSYSQNFSFLNNTYSPGISYYYNVHHIILMAISVMAMTIGYFILKNKKIN